MNIEKVTPGIFYTFVAVGIAILILTYYFLKRKLRQDSNNNGNYFERKINLLHSWIDRIYRHVWITLLIILTAIFIFAFYKEYYLVNFLIIYCAGIAILIYSLMNAAKKAFDDHKHDSKLLARIITFIGKRFKETSLRGWGILSYVMLFMLATMVAQFYLDDYKLEKLNHIFWEHAWLELLSGLFIYFILEYKLHEYGEKPTEDGRRDYNWILDSIGKSKTTVRILDNDFSSFFQDRHAESDFNKEQKSIERLHETLSNTLVNLKSGEKIKILLLHPKTLAAQQRHDDLQEHYNGNLKEDFDLFKNMNTGLQVLYNIILKIKQENKPVEKVEVRLFKTSYSLLFVSWNEYINFSLLRPDMLTDEKTFKTIQNTPLAGYLIDNFEAIWRNDDTVSLEHYKKVELKYESSQQLLGKDNTPLLFDWGPDSYDYDLPVFVCVDRDNIGEFFEDGDRVQVHHDNKYTWARIYELKNRSGIVDAGSDIEDTGICNIYDFAKSQIKSKNYIHDKRYFSNKKIYKLTYTYQRRIMLQDVEYVRKRLKSTRYCFTPYTKYSVHLGLHMRKTLDSLYEFYTNYYNDYLKENKEYNGHPYKRILAQYRCSLEKNSSNISATNTDVDEEYLINRKTGSKLDSINFLSEINKLVEEIGYSDTLTNSELQKKLNTINDLNVFINKTIQADLLRIKGLKNDTSAKKTRDSIDYIVLVNLIRVQVDKDSKNQTNDNHEDGYKENCADYTVLHFIGKKNIIGGMPMIYSAEKRGDEIIRKEKIRTYNFNTALDSIYINHRNTDEDGYIRIVDSSGVKYDEIEARHRTRKEDNPNIPIEEVVINENNKCGYRNVIAIEFHKVK